MGPHARGLHVVTATVPAADKFERSGGYAPHPAQTVRPWATAATLAQADPNNPHGVLLAPYLAPAADGSGEEEGLIVAAVFDTNSSDMQVKGQRAEACCPGSSACACVPNSSA